MGTCLRFVSVLIATICAVAGSQTGDVADGHNRAVEPLLQSLYQTFADFLNQPTYCAKSTWEYLSPVEDTNRIVYVADQSHKAVCSIVIYAADLIGALQ